MKGWKKVTKPDPCPICEKPDWCTVGEKFICCMRVESESPCKNGGWLHALNSTPKEFTPIPKLVEPPRINATRLIEEWRLKTLGEWIEKLAARLAVSIAALSSLDVAWAAAHRAWAWPMRDGYGNPIGIRLRTPSGKKFAVTGSRQGLFIPQMKPGMDCYICEGPTDTAAMLSVGLFAIGRPSCLGCEPMVQDFIRANGIRQVIIVADADEPGQRGAEKLQTALRVKSKIWTPGAKDIREAVKNGLTKNLIELQTRSILWTIK